MKTISGLSKKEVGGYIEEIAPFPDPVAIICNEEGKIDGLPLNRAIKDEDGDIVDVIAGTFLVVGCNPDESNFASLSDELMCGVTLKAEKTETVFLLYFFIRTAKGGLQNGRIFGGLSRSSRACDAGG